MDVNNTSKKLKKSVKRKKSLASVDEAKSKPALKKNQGTPKELSQFVKVDGSPPKKKKLGSLKESNIHNGKAGKKKVGNLSNQNGTNTSSKVTNESKNGGSKKNKKPIPLFESDDEQDDEHVTKLHGVVGEDSDIEMDDDFASDESLDGSASGNDDSGNELPIEKKSRLLDKRKQKTADEGESELRLNIAGQQKYELPSVDEVEKQLKELPNLQIIRDRISELFR
ncbi:hypothetical protein OSTOST_23732, partial [Ostertagia ostertagi]